MLSNNRKMNSEINVIEILWRFFEQWKAVLIFSLVFALLFSSAKFVKDTKDYNKAGEQAVVVEDSGDVAGSISAILDGLDETDRKAVERQLKEKELLDAKEDYYSNSLVFHIDPGNYAQLQLQYKIDAAAEEENKVLVEAYENALFSEDFAADIAETIDPELDKKYVYELLVIPDSDSGTESYSATDARETLLVKILIPSGSDPAELKDAIDSFVMAQKKPLSGSVGEHNIKLISDEVVTSSNIALAAEQTEFMSKLTDARTNYTKNYALLTDQQRAAYNTITMLKSGEVNEATAEDNPEPHISVKAGAAGFIIGAFIYGVALGIILLLRRRTISEADTGYYPGVRNLYSFFNNGAKKGLFRSAAVEKIRRRKQIGLEDQAIECAEKISLVCEREEQSNVTILSPGSLDEDCDKLIAEVCKLLTQAGIDASKKELANSGLEIKEKELAEASPVIITIVEDKTSLDGFNKLMNTCKNYQVDVLGTLYYGTR